MNKAILICDDDDGILDVASTIIESEGYRVVKVINSINIFDKVEKENPSLILVDLWMPLLSGDEIVKKLKASKHFKDIPIVVISASPEGEMVARNAGAQDFLPKPFDIFDLLNLVNRYTTPQID